MNVRKKKSTNTETLCECVAIRKKNYRTTYYGGNKKIEIYGLNINKFLHKNSNLLCWIFGILFSLSAYFIKNIFFRFLKKVKMKLLVLELDYCWRCKDNG